MITIPSGLLDWRVVVESNSGLKLICCRGHCKRKGKDASNNIRNPSKFELLVFNTTDDPFDMDPLNDRLPDETIVRLQRMLPSGFCDETRNQGRNETPGGSLA
jgi:hypothetical protein